MKIITEDQLALRQLRFEKGWSLEEASQLLEIKSKGLGHIENGRVLLPNERIRRILSAYGFHYHDFIRAKKQLKDEIRNRPRRKIIRSVLSNKDRRSYQKLITKEVKVLRILRQMKNLTQRQASSACRYSRPTIGHIENGRIELPLSRIQYIVTSYGFPIEEFHRLMKEEILRDEITKSCIDKILILGEDKLKLVSNIIESFSERH